jgi:hypothetical protein
MTRHRSADLRPGDTFGQLVVTGAAFSPVPGKAAMVPVRCSCGVEKTMGAPALRKAQSCGCLRVAWSRHPRKHGAYTVNPGEPRERLYGVWSNMRSRCNNPNNKMFRHYGGRGVTVCPAWADYAAFRDWALDHGYIQGLEIDRVDNDGNYEPANCRWSTHSQNMRNKRDNHLLTCWGETKTMTEWVEDGRCTSSYDTVRSRVKRGWSVEDALSLPVSNARYRSR